jgi:hypothetical protein
LACLDVLGLGDLEVQPPILATVTKALRRSEDPDCNTDSDGFPHVGQIFMAVHGLIPEIVIQPGKRTSEYLKHQSFLLLSLCEAQSFVIRDTKTECTSHHFHLSLDGKAMSCTTLSALETLAKAHILHAPLVGERCDDGGHGICIGATRVAVSPATFLLCGTVSFTKESVMMMVVKHFAFYSSMPTTTNLLIRSLSTSVDS